MTPPLKPVGVFDFAAIIAEAQRPLIERIDALTAKIEALSAQRVAEVLDSTAMAVRFGKSVEAFNRWIGRPGGRHVLALAKVDKQTGKRTWSRSEVDALLVRGTR